MAQQRPVRNSNPERETFHKFFKCGLIEHDQHLHNLVSTSKNHHNNDRTRSSTLTTTTTTELETYHSFSFALLQIWSPTRGQTRRVDSQTQYKRFRRSLIDSTQLSRFDEM
ncbi:hypothetical protein HYC85_001952 [Camellia sinensis]|uniref:Uncharacterized protein n=1 Tax=Camellia sinensis TaxID=4442 RepID=A0A7J7I6U0_CAMSI|nr:hypothetical protein HYC85_001952 [Camellia sinensis]